MYFTALVTDNPGMSDTRSNLRDDFVSYLRDHPGHPDVVVHHAGPTLSDDGGSITGLLLVVEAPSIEAARAFAADSPYGRGGIFAATEVRRWDWTTGCPG